MKGYRIILVRVLVYALFVLAGLVVSSCSKIDSAQASIEGMYKCDSSYSTVLVLEFRSNGIVVLYSSVKESNSGRYEIPGHSGWSSQYRENGTYSISGTKVTTNLETFGKWQEFAVDGNDLLRLNTSEVYTKW